MTEDLKPCPFCGGKNIELKRFFISCKNNECHASLHTDIMRGNRQPIEFIKQKWNTRAESKSEWISVNERLPDNANKVLTMVGGFYDICMYENPNWYSMMWREFTLEVTHWIPLPEMPK